MSTIVEKKRGGYTVKGGKGKGGGGGRTPVEARDSLHSVVYAAILDLLSEGEIEGLVNGLQSVVLDGTPLRNADGSFNFEDVTVDYRSGTLDQEYIKGFPSVEATTPIQVELKQRTPWVRSVTNTRLSAVRVTLGTNGLSKANTSNGDITGYSVAYKIELQTDGGAWEVVVDSSLTGKTTSSYRRTHRIDLPKATTGWLVRVTRITPDSDSSTIADGTLIDSFSEVVDAKLRFPNSALAGIRLNAQQFSSIPTRAYHLRGRRVRVPVNYDPATRTYTGVWNGQFKIAYTNNPAWVFYDIATHKRYGLGRKIPEALLNKGALYQIAAYCDEPVSDGKGGMEPRFTCNAYLQKEAEAYKVLQDLVSVFRGMTYYSSSAIQTVADMPRDAVYNYNQTNVVGGRFAYSGIDIEQRYTVALVSYSDMTDYGRQKVVYVQDAEAIRRYGVNKTEIVGFGCTSESQAQRLGKWVLASSKFETQTVAFTVDRSGQIVTPGKVVKIMDSAFAGKRLGGRIVSATETQVVVDKPCDAVFGDVLTVNLPNGTAASRYITSASTVDGVQTLTVGASFGAVPTAGANWCVDTEEVASREFAVLSVKDNQDGTFAVTALQHERQKFDFIDNGTKIEPKPVTIVPPGVQVAPASVSLSTYDRVAEDGTSSLSVTISWPAVENGSSYDVEWNRSNSGWVRMPRTQLREVEIRNVFSGEYVARVRAVSALEIPSSWVVSDVLNVIANSKPPRNYDLFTVQELDGGLRKYNFEYTTMDPPSDLAGAEIRYVIGHPAQFTWEEMTPLDAGYYTSAFTTTQPEAGPWTFACRARNRSGKLSEGMLVRQVDLQQNFNQERIPDLTPPPRPTGFDGYVGLSVATLFTALPTYTQGHGHKLTKFYAAEVTAAKPNPVFADATQVADTTDTHATATVIIGKSYRFWATWTSVDGVESAASSNYVTIVAGKVGDADLSDDLDLASKLADGSISGTKLASGAIDATKFANSIEPVTVWAGAALPTTKSTENLTWQGKLYTWDGAAYVLPPAGELADGSVTSAKLAAGAVTAGTIAAGAVSADQIAANAITASKLVVADRSNMLSDTEFKDLTYWYTNFVTSTDAEAVAAINTSPVLANVAGTTANDELYNRSKEYFLSVEPGKSYRVTLDVYIKAGWNGYGQLNLQGYTTNGSTGTTSGNAYTADYRTTPAAAAVTQSLEFDYTASATTAFVRFRFLCTYTNAAVAGIFIGNPRVRLKQDATLIVDGAITADKLAANSIAVGTAAIQSGAIVNAHIGNLSADKIDAGTLNAARIGAGTITSSHLSANSVIAGKIAANAVTAGTIAANAVTAGTIAANAVTATQIAAGAVTVDKLAAGSITAEKLSVGVGGNLCPDAAFTPGLAFWAHENYIRTGIFGVNLNDTYSVNGSPTLFIKDTYSGSAGYLGVISVPISVVPGERYEFSAYMATHRCVGEMHVLFNNTSGGWTAAEFPGTAVDEKDGSLSLQNYKRVGGFATVPAGYTRMRLILRKFGTQSTASSYLFATRPFIGRAGDNQTELSPWTPSGSTQLMPDGITTPSISALAGRFGDIEIRPTAGASGCIRVYDTNGTLRVRLGVW